jgi:hypothetical protein
MVSYTFQGLWTPGRVIQEIIFWINNVIELEYLDEFTVIGKNSLGCEAAPQVKMVDEETVG